MLVSLNPKTINTASRHKSVSTTFAVIREVKEDPKITDYNKLSELYNNLYLTNLRTYFNVETKAKFMVRDVKRKIENKIRKSKTEETYHSKI